MRRKLLALLAVIAVVLVFLALSRERAARTVTEPTTSAVSPRPTSEAPLERPEPPRPVDGPVAPAHAPAAKPKAASAPPDVLHLRGTVLVIDANDQQHPRESGRFTLLLWSSQTEAVAHPVRVKEGAWSLDVNEASHFESMSVQLFELGNRTTIAATEPEERFRIPGDGRVDLRVRWPPCLTLHASPDGPQSLRWFEPGPEAGTDLAHPGMLPSVVGGVSGSGSSTLYLNSPDEGSRWVYVGSRGYVWQRIEVLPAEYERTVTLERGGDLEVSVEAFERNPGTRLRLFSSATGKDVPLAEVAPGSWNPCWIEGLPLGWLEVRAHVGDPHSPDLYGSVETEIRDGEMSAVTLYLNPR